RLTDRPADREIQLTRRRLLLLIAALLAVPATLVSDSLIADGSNVSILAAGSVPLSVLVLLRLADLVRAKERKAARERIVREAGAALVAATTRTEMHGGALAAALALVEGLRDARVSVLHGSEEELTVVASGGSRADRARGVSVALASLPGPVVEAFSRHCSVVLEPMPALDLPPAANDPNVHDDGTPAGQEGPRSVLVVPLASRQAVRGALVATSERPLKDEVRRSLEALANQVSLALESAALTEQVFRRRHERRFRALVENSSALVSVVGADGRVSFVSPSAQRLLGVPEAALLGKHPFSRIHADDRYRACALLDRAWAVPGVCEPIEARFRYGEGDWRWFEVVVDNLLDEPEVAGIVIHARDITDRKVAQGRLEASEARFRSLVQHASDVVIVLDDDLRMTYLSPSVERVLGCSAERLTGSPWLDLVGPDDALQACDLTGDTVTRSSMELRFRRRDGSRLILDTTITDLRHDPAVRGIVLNGRDVTDRRSLEKQLHHQALHDSLTGLANRALFIDRLEHSLSRRAQRRGLVAALFVDLDEFKTVNDGLGSAAGDALLNLVATRLTGCLRSGDTAARLGGDEFAVLLEDIGDQSLVIRTAEQIQSALRAPFELDGREQRVTASIGIALDDGEAASAEALLRDADVAMHLAKSKGKDQYQVFEAGMRTALFERLRLKSEMSVGLDRQEFALRYQPVVSLSTGKLIGLEALLRWKHPARELLAPDSFISVAEETGYIVPLGRWVLDQACGQIQAWRSQ
ncbi:MAG TPA: diguanylate cyclase, partial [Acidimicrobiales bacterium]|nr:diguanylate cyclase [Acidimicrobiales bacterium]